MRILILFGHPAFQNSRINKEMVKGLDDLADITFNDLYEAYPDMDIDIDREQQLLSEHDCIIFHHPMYWYSSPAIFKEWQDLVLEHGWAYGSKGKALANKWFFNAITTGGSQRVYSKDGTLKQTVRDFLLPFTQMARLCNMNPLPPFVVHGAHTVSEEVIKKARKDYRALLQLITADRVNIEHVLELEYLNDLIDKE